MSGYVGMEKKRPMPHKQRMKISKAHDEIHRKARAYDGLIAYVRTIHAQDTARLSSGTPPTRTMRARAAAWNALPADVRRDVETK